MNATDLTKNGFRNWRRFSITSAGELLASLPTAPGVYAIILAQPQPRRSGSSDIAYIGRAVNQNGLRGRVRQYFHPGPTQSTNIAMKSRLSEPNCDLRLGFIQTYNAASARRLESDLLVEFESEHGELPPYNRQRALDLMSRLAMNEPAG